MSNGLFDSTVLEMPTVLSVLPFVGSFLFPKNKISLRLFEMRYMKLVFDALANSRIIGMVQPQENGTDLYKIGCAGRISAFTETSNDVILITLTGISRFNVVRELGNCPIYRMIEADFKPFVSDFENFSFKIDREKLFAKLDWYVYSQKIDINSNVFKDEPDETLLSALLSILPFKNIEKQALLETQTPQELFETIMLLMETGFGSKKN